MVAQADCSAVLPGGRCEAGGSYKVVTGLPVDDFSRSMMDATGRELAEELELAKSLLK